jgi:hypothetical protein
VNQGGSRLPNHHEVRPFRQQRSRQAVSDVGVAVGAQLHERARDRQEQHRRQPGQ